MWLFRVLTKDPLHCQDSVKEQGTPEREPAVFAVRWVQATDDKKDRNMTCFKQFYQDVEDQP
jgi:hypothetical protein